MKKREHTGLSQLPGSVVFGDGRWRKEEGEVPKRGWSEVK